MIFDYLVDLVNPETGLYSCKSDTELSRFPILSLNMSEIDASDIMTFDQLGTNLNDTKVWFRVGVQGYPLQMISNYQNVEIN